MDKISPTEREKALIEPLEARIAPAVLIGPTRVRYLDVDGDMITVSVSKGSLDLQKNFVFVAAGRGERLQAIVLTDDSDKFADASLAITTVRGPTGNGKVNIGYIDARGIDLETVKVAGNLGRIDVGDTDFSTAALDILNVGSFGRLPQSTDENTSSVNGNLVTLKVHGRMSAHLSVLGEAHSLGGNIGSIAIDGFLAGGADDNSGRITSTGTIGMVSIKGGIRGGAGDHSASIAAGAGLHTVTVFGSVKSGSGAASGSIQAGENIGSILVKGDVHGSGASPVLITAGGIPLNDSESDATLDRLRVDGNVTFAKVLAGYDLSGEPVNGDAQIGRIPGAR